MAITECQTLVLVDRLAIESSRCAYCGYEAQAGLPYGAAINGSLHQSATREQSAPKPPFLRLEMQESLFSPGETNDLSI